MTWRRTVPRRRFSGFCSRTYRSVTNDGRANTPGSPQSPIEKTAQAILDARQKYAGASFAELYGEKMYLFADLIAAHEANDAAVLKAYWDVGREIVEKQGGEARQFYFEECANPPIGIVLGSERNEAVIRYALNDHERNLFAVKYHLDLPTDEELCLELQRERAAIEEALLLKGKSRQGK